MNFFEQQERARRNTTRLVLLLALAVISLIAVISLVLVGLLYLMDGETLTREDHGAALLQLLDWRLLAAIAAAVIAVVALGGAYKTAQLSSGGQAVAEALGGRPINTATGDSDERKILNVVEEMAIASGTPVPPVYLIEDEAINAFAAGHDPHDAVIGITRGCIRLLSRSELQGVVAHEFSHIFHGDMRLNIRLVSLLHGILAIGLIGQLLLRSALYPRMMRRSRQDNSAIAIMAIGAALAVLGFVGTLFGGLIKAAVSRQREFLADASAVQFTRDPQGIGGAVKKIGGYRPGSQLRAAQAAEFSHMFFGQGVTGSLSAVMATHPPLEERIRRIEPQWDGNFPELKPEPEPAVAAPVGAGAGATASAEDRLRSVAILAGVAYSQQAASQAIEAIGQPQAAHLEYAHQALAELDTELKDAAHDPYAARALIYGLLLSKDPEVRSEQLQQLEQHALPDVYRQLGPLIARIDAMDPRLRLPLVELALPALKQLSSSQYPVFKQCLELLIAADRKLSPMEWALRRILIDNIETRPRGDKHYRFVQLRPEATVLLSVLAHAGHDDSGQAQAAFTAAADLLPMIGCELLPASEAGIAALDRALERLRQLRPLEKPDLLRALAHCIQHDGQITVTEAELLRAIADTLDCPLPPLLQPGSE